MGAIKLFYLRSGSSPKRNLGKAGDTVNALRM